MRLVPMLAVPIDFLLHRVLDPCERGLLSDVINLATSMDFLFEKYENLACEARDFQKGWNALWLAQEKSVLAAIPLIGERMSAGNRARFQLMNSIDSKIKSLQDIESKLRHFVDTNTSTAAELRRTGSLNIAIDRMLLAAVEEELARRIRAVCTGDRLLNLNCCSMPDFVASKQLEFAAAPPLQSPEKLQISQSTQSESQTQSQPDQNFSSSASEERLPSFEH